MSESLLPERNNAREIMIEISNIDKSGMMYPDLKIELVRFA